MGILSKYITEKGCKSLRVVAFSLLSWLMKMNQPLNARRWSSVTKCLIWSA
jgi:hypothetical protein